MKTTVELYAGIRLLVLRTFTFLLLFIFGANGVWASFTCQNTTPMLSGGTNYTLGSGPEGIAAADFNSDGKLDLIVSSESASTVSLALGDGVGGFGTPSSFSVGANGARDIVVADFNADGNPDFAVSNVLTAKIWVGYGNGSGGFSSIVSYTTGDVGAPASPWHLTTGDYNSDGKIDIATNNGANVSVFNNTGSAFSKRIPNINAAGGGEGIATADFDSDGKPDIILTMGGGAKVLFNDGATTPGWTAYTTPISTSETISNVTTADFDGDGNVDDAVAGGYFSNSGGSFYSLTGNTGRTMTLAQSSGFGNYWGGNIKAGDFNADGKMDFAMASGYSAVFNFSNNGFVLLNQGSAVFGDSTALSAGGGHIPVAPVVADFNADGKPDVAYSSVVAGESLVVLNHFNENATRKTDYNGDGRSDYAVWRPSNGIWYNWHSYFGTQTYNIYGSNGDIPVPGDYDGDKKTDMALLRPGTPNVWYITYSSDSSTHTIQWGSTGDYLTPADFDGDGKTDIAVWRPSNGTWYIIKSSNGANQYIYYGSGGDIPVQGDYDGDGLADAAVFRTGNTSWYVLSSLTAGSSNFSWGVGSDNLVPGDYDGDCKNDYAVWRSSDQTWYVYKSSTASSFQVQYGNSSDIPQPADFDGDGKTDLALWTKSTGGWAVKTSSHGILTLSSWGLTTDKPTTSLFPYTSVIP
ncbi:MAG TPA: VCBS repeat-containing protein [Pyrinomonadaceae bacterium]|jgi:hypothetical protein|nr:VCBS repeat-containing protein [Pyrinomonadaceae bacterium]